MRNLDFLAAKQGRGAWIWDQALWLLAPGAIAFLVGLLFFLKYLTPEPNGARPRPAVQDQQHQAETPADAPAPHAEH